MYENGAILAKVRSLTNALIADEAGAKVNSAGALRHFLDFESRYYEIARTLPVTTREAEEAMIKETKKKIGKYAPSTLPKKGEKEDIIARCEFAIILREHCASSFYRDADALTLEHLYWIANSIENLIRNHYDDAAKYQEVLDWTYDQIDLYSGTLSDRVTGIHMKYLIIQESLLSEMVKIGIPSLMLHSYWSAVTEKYRDLADRTDLRVDTFRDIFGNCSKTCEEDITEEERIQLEKYVFEASEDKTTERSNLRKIMTYCQSVDESIEDNPFIDLLFAKDKGINHKDWYDYGVKFFEVIADNIDKLSYDTELRALMGDQINFIYGHISLPVSGLNEGVINKINSMLNVPNTCRGIFRSLLEKLSKTLSDYNTTIFHIPSSVDSLLTGTV